MALRRFKEWGMGTFVGDFVYNGWCLGSIRWSNCSEWLTGRHTCRYCLRTKATRRRHTISEWH